MQHDKTLARQSDIYGLQIKGTEKVQELELPPDFLHPGWHLLSSVFKSFSLPTSDAFNWLWTETKTGKVRLGAGEV